jgi:hypothetical protein
VTLSLAYSCVPLDVDLPPLKLERGAKQICSRGGRGNRIALLSAAAR